jgi:hypothetical protein
LESCHDILFSIICFVPLPCINVCVLRTMAKQAKLLYLAWSWILKAARLVKYLGNLCLEMFDWTARGCYFNKSLCHSIHSNIITCKGIHHMFIVIYPMPIEC